jgi:hypothetical protein
MRTAPGRSSSKLTPERRWRDGTTAYADLAVLRQLQLVRQQAVAAQRYAQCPMLLQRPACPRRGRWQSSQTACDHRVRRWQHAVSLGWHSTRGARS